MSQFNIVMPKLGESVQEATITKWFKKAGDTIQEDEALFEIATDKVDSEIPSPVEGKIIKIIYEENSLVAVGEILAIIDTGIESSEPEAADVKTVSNEPEQKLHKSPSEKEKASSEKPVIHSGRFYSPLVQNIAKEEGIGFNELEKIKGSGQNGRVTKKDIEDYLEQNKSGNQMPIESAKTTASLPGSASSKPALKLNLQVNAGDEVVQMDRMRKMIAENMLLSQQTSAHVTSFIEADVTKIVQWRNKLKETFEKREKQKLTFMPVFVEATAKALKEFPYLNASVDGDKIILRKAINIGMAVALPSGNLIVPVIRNADQKSIIGLATDVNTLASNARNSKLNPDDVAGGTFTITNFGTFGNLTGTPIINQPQVGIIATGTIQKKPVVLDTPAGEVIAIRHIMMLALSYDHRIVDGALGGAFLQRLANILENFSSDYNV
jgi:2-oxoglutarate dehydrogenase E2 component (dihydrolipoamide succinyltransferase)